MGLELGKSFDRNYNLRIPFLNGFYDVGIYFNKKSTFLLFSVDSKIQTGKSEGVKINMFKNIESSKFCETFLELHNYRKSTLDILNQFKCVKPEYFHEISFVMNETINLSKFELDDKVLFDCLNIYGFTLNSYQDEFLFLITERQNIATKLGKKIVRTSGIQIATTQATHMLNDYHKESLTAGKAGYEKYAPLDSSVRKIIKLDEE
ncbi:MAG: hypothetical protein K9L62_10265 [Vallitaleaceae bacterium]|nr:hypothetical protein [Vallitaleaceae bacterium]